MILRAATAAIALVLPVIVAGSVGAASPGGSGLIVFASKRSQNLFAQVYSTTLAGGGRRLLGRPLNSPTTVLLSPDGSQVALVNQEADFNDEIYVARIDGRGWRRIGLGREAAWAPDSRRLAFTREVETAPGSFTAQVFVADVLTGTERELAEGVHPSWSPDGRRIALSQNLESQLEPSVTIVNAADGGVVRRLAVKGEATWSPRGGRIAVVYGTLTIISEDGRTLSRPRVEGPLGSDPAWSSDGGRLAVVDAGRVIVTRFDGSGRRVVARTIAEDIGSPAWSPDGRWLAFANKSDIYAVRVDGKGLRRVTREPRGTRIVSPPVWSRSGRIFFTSRRPFKDYDLYTMRADGSAVRRLTRTSLSESAPVWSPDGRRIAFTRESRLFVVDKLGGRVRRIPVRGVPQQGSPSWSPDGSQLAFVGGRAAERTTGIYTVGSSGGPAKAIVRDLYAYEPRWSPDGAHIAFGMSGELFVVRPDGRGLRKVAAPPEFPRGGGDCSYFLDALAWVPGGRLGFVYHLECRGNPGPYELTIQIVRLDGTQEQSLEANSTGRLVWSADGQWIVQSGEYADWNLDENMDGEIVRMRSDGAGRIGLTRDRTGIDPDWQPVCMRLGTRRSDRLSGTSGDELLCGLGGSDTITGGAGRDRLFGEDGNDRFFARDGEFDVVGCGSGRDTVVADREDLVGSDCERIKRSRR